MDRKEFFRLAQKNIDKRYYDTLGRSLKPKEIEVAVYGILDSILQVLEAGDEVRLIPFGVFYPRAICREGQVTSAKIVFQPFVGSNDRLLRRLQALPIFSRPDTSQVTIGSEVVDGARSLRILDERGRELYSVNEVAKMVGLSVSTVYKTLARLGDQVEVVENGTPKKYPRSIVPLLQGPKKRNRKVKLPPEGYFTLEEAARRVGVSNVTLYEYKRKFPTHLVSFDQGSTKYYDENFVQLALRVKKYGHPDKSSSEVSASWG